MDSYERDSLCSILLQNGQILMIDVKYDNDVHSMMDTSGDPNFWSFFYTD